MHHPTSFLLQLRQWSILPVLLLLFGLSACNDEDPDISTETPFVYSNGHFIVNEGNFGAGNGSITFHNDDTLVANVFEAANGRGPGDVVQSALVSNGKLFVVVNNDNRVEVAGTDSLKMVRTIENLNLPRHIVAVGGNKGYLTNWGSFDGAIPAYITVLDLAQGAAVDTVNLGAFLGSERIIVSAGFAYVANSFSNTLAILNTVTDEVVDVVEVGDAPQGMALAGGKLWVLCAGYSNDWQDPTDDTPATLVSVDLGTGAVLSTLQVGEVGDHPSLLVVTPDFNQLLVANNGGVYSVPVAAPNWPNAPLIDGINAYGMSVLPDGKLYVTDAMGFTSTGRVMVYDPLTGGLEQSFNSGGIGPNNVVAVP